MYELPQSECHVFAVNHGIIACKTIMHFIVTIIEASTTSFVSSGLHLQKCLLRVLYVGVPVINKNCLFLRSEGNKRVSESTVWHEQTLSAHEKCNE